jgi:YVTN family beta-propeller protein
MVAAQVRDAEPGEIMKLASAVFCACACLPLKLPAASYDIFVTNERSGDVTVIRGADFSVQATLPVGKRPRGIHLSGDGKVIYVAVSGTPMEGPPQLDAKGNPIFLHKKGDDDDVAADKAADGIVQIEASSHKLIGKLNAGSDPEEFALSKDGSRIYISNEDTKTASVINVASGKVEHIIPVGQEPEGVTTTPDGRQFYVTCEAGGDIYLIDAGSFEISHHFKVNGRPRSVGLLADGSIAFIPSESAGELNVIDAKQGVVLKTISLPVGSRPMKAVVSTDDRKVYLSNGRAGTVTVLDTRDYSLLSTIKVGTRPWGIGFSPDGKYLFAANGPSNDVSVVDLSRNQEIARVKAGESPWGLAIVPTR